MERTVQKIINKLEAGNYLSEDMHDMHIYVLQKWLEQLIVSTIIYATALVFHVVLPTILFHIIYMSIRKHCGGYHCESYAACFVFSIIMYATNILMYQLAAYVIKPLAILCIISVIYIIITGAKNNENIHWTLEDLSRTSVITRIYTVIYGVMICAMWIVGLPEAYIIFSMMGLIYPALTLLIETARISK